MEDAKNSKGKWIKDKKEGFRMVNEDHKRFQEEQRDLKNRYIGDDHNNRTSGLDPKYNNGSNTDKSPGTTGRNI